jgi:4-hydroxythreonine-4-phosphate dehydrogenase
MKKPVIAITMGDPAGIGPEIILKALNHSEVMDACRPLIVGDPSVLAAAARHLDPVPSLKSIQRIDQIKETDDQAYLYAASDLAGARVTPGQPDPAFGPAVLRAIRLASRWALQRKVQAMVTCPISKEIIRAGRPHFTGHTEFLARLSRTRTFGMMLAGERLKVSLVTIHLPLKKALRVLTQNKIRQTIQLTHQTLTGWFGIQAPRLALAGLNPHAGEKGAFGTEEETILQPAVTEARSRGIDLSGPHPADTLFYWAAQGRYDAVIALYHDQGLIPLKLLHFDKAVNLTMGLPFIRTSVDHGTAFDIAGQGRANPNSLVAAILLAADFTRRTPSWP